MYVCVLGGGGGGGGGVELCNYRYLLSSGHRMLHGRDSFQIKLDLRRYQKRNILLAAPALSV